ncbi:hypothetical protein [Streptomyces sp. NPDC055058]
MPARAGSTEAAVGLMDRLLVAEAAEGTMRSTVNRIRSAGRGTRRAGRLRGHSIDSSHPPTHLRRERLLTVEPARAGVPAHAGRERRIAAELADVRTEVARRIIRDGFDTTV